MREPIVESQAAVFRPEIRFVVDKSSDISRVKSDKEVDKRQESPGEDCGPGEDS